MRAGLQGACACVRSPGACVCVRALSCILRVCALAREFVCYIAHTLLVRVLVLVLSGLVCRFF